MADVKRARPRKRSPRTRQPKKVVVPWLALARAIAAELGVLQHGQLRMIVDRLNQIEGHLGKLRAEGLRGAVERLIEVHYAATKRGRRRR